MNNIIIQEQKETLSNKGLIEYTTYIEMLREATINRLLAVSSDANEVFRILGELKAYSRLIENIKPKKSGPGLFGTSTKV